MDGKIFFLGLLLAILALAWVGAGVMWRAAEVGEIVGPIEPAHFTELTVVSVGTGNEYENPERGGPATVIGFGNTTILVDAGRGVAEGLREAAIPLQQVRIVVLTNLLPVNTMGLDDLLFTGWLVPREAPIRIIGPTGTRQFVESFQAAHAVGREALSKSLGLAIEGAMIHVDEVSSDYHEEINGLTLDAVSLPDGPLPTLAWRFSDGENEEAQRVVVSGSGWNSDILASFAARADALIHEAAYLPTVAELEGSTGVEVENPERIEREAKFHTSILDVGDLARDAQVDRLVLVRLRPPPFFKLQIRSIVGNDFEGLILVPDDGDIVFP
jgi:ribonuclease BN (tRNA processing enzyme)